MIGAGYIVLSGNAVATSTYRRLTQAKQRCPTHPEVTKKGSTKRKTPPAHLRQHGATHALAHTRTPMKEQSTHVKVPVSGEHGREHRGRSRTFRRILLRLVEKTQARLAPHVDHEGDLVADAKGRGRHLPFTGTRAENPARKATQMDKVCKPRRRSQAPRSSFIATTLTRKNRWAPSGHRKRLTRAPPSLHPACTLMLIG